MLLVIANQDFYYREYGDTRRSLEEAGVTVTVAAARRDTCRPHANSGQGADGGLVMPDLAITDARMADYDAVGFVGGWGAVMYEPTYTGVFDNPAFNVPAAVRQAAGRLVEEAVRGDKVLAAICHGVTVLAWARVDGRSPIAGRTVSAYDGGSPGSTYQGTHYADNQATVRMQVERLAGATMVRGRSMGNPAIADDDVVVDGRIITAENYDSAREFGRVIARQLGR
ncbi:MAG: DJ-1/PfpI family protein [Armatimonadetes bacterium]|nr:DJ-1/PfpI family protein [Armatimonadota bacterium]